MSVPTRRHNICSDERCKMCLDDHERLGKYLENHCVHSMPRDWLGEYRKWLDKKYGSRAAEDKYGWGSEITWDTDNINLFINEWNEDMNA